MTETKFSFRYAFSQKGWVNTDIFRESISFFNTETKTKLSSPLQYQLLIVDGHSSHECLETIKFCHDNCIILYCLPSHTTHAPQPLDVGLFSPLKQAWARAVASEEYDGRKVMKANFLEIYGNAHLKSFTSANILSSFHKTGIWPLDPTIITTDMMAMSTTESVDINTVSPIVIPSPVKQGAQYFWNEHERQKAAQLSVETPCTPTCLSQTMFHTPSQLPRTPSRLPINPQLHQNLSPIHHSSQQPSPTLTDPFLDNCPHDGATDLHASFADSSMAFLMPPTHISATPTIPPNAYLRHSSIGIAQTPIANSPPLPPGSDPDALLTNGTDLCAEVTALKCHVLELEEKMEAGVDTANAQLLFMARTCPKSHWVESHYNPTKVTG